MDNLPIATVRCRWYVLAVVPHAQLRVCERAKDIGISTYCPMGKTIAVVRRRMVETVRALMPGYVFVALPVIEPRFDYFQNDDLGSTEPIRGCLGFVPDANGARGIVADNEIQSMREREAKGDFDLTGKSEDGKYAVPRWVKRGAFVRLTNGPFKGFLGDIDKVVGPKMVRIDVTIFGRTSSATVPMDWIERVR